MKYAMAYADKIVLVCAYCQEHLENEDGYNIDDYSSIPEIIQCASCKKVNKVPKTVAKMLNG